MIGAWVGYFVDLFDIYLPVVALAPIMAYFLPETLDAGTAAILGGLLFGATIVARPLGSIIFGWIGDAMGRKKATIISMNGAAAITLLMAFLPGHAQIGIAGALLFIALRLIGGVFLGGAYTGANPLAMENAPKSKRGLYSALINTGFPLAYAAISLLTLLLLFLIPADGPESPYAYWGWRIPFVIGAFMAFLVANYVRRQIPESEAFTDTQAKSGAEKREAPLRRLMRGETRRTLLQVFLLLSGLWLATQPIAATLPKVLVDDVGLSARGTTATLVVGYLLLAVMNVLFGLAGQRFGRRPVLITGGLLITVVCSSLYYVLLEFGTGNPTIAVAAVIALVAIVVAPFGLMPAYINERFPTSVRASGYGFAYGASVVLPSFFGVYQAGLGNFMPIQYATIVLLAVGGLLATIGAFWGPETKHVDLHAF
jgi:MFS family permease